MRPGRRPSATPGPDRAVWVVRVPADLGDRLLRAADLEPAVEDRRQQPGWRRRARAGTRARGPRPSPIPQDRRRTGPRARRARRAGSRARARPTSHPTSSGSPSVQSASRWDCQRQGDVTCAHEAVVRAVEPTLGEVAVADRQPRHLAREPQRERLIDRRRDRVRGPSPRPSYASARSPRSRADPAGVGGRGGGRSRARGSRACRSGSGRSRRGRVRPRRRAGPRSGAPDSRRASRW